MRYVVWLCVPAVVYLLIAYYWRRHGADFPTGDETYYLAVTESIVDDFDVDVQNNLARLGLVEPDSQSIVRPHGWFSVHNLGLPSLLAVPWALRGQWGARRMLALCCALAAPALYRTINRIWQCPRNSLPISLALALSMPLLHGCTQIYPDLPAGILLLFAAESAMAAERGAGTIRWRELLLAVALAFLPWLHIRYAAPALVALAWYADAARRPFCLALGAAFAGSLACLASYNVYAFGKMTGPYSEDGLVLHLNNLIVFLGLHFDQAQGMFLQQPLWLLGLVGLAPMWRCCRRSSLWWLLLYASAIVPNVMHPNWYGGYSYVGRFGCSSVLLWAFPLAYGARMIFAESKVGPTAVALVSVAFQAWLGASWLYAREGLHGRGMLGLVLPESVWACNSVYPVAIKIYLPYWLPWAEFWRYPANYAALILAGGALACGWFWQRRRPLAGTCVAVSMLAAVSLAVGVQPRLAPASWAADALPGDVGRSDGGVRVAAEGRDGRGALVKTPDLFAAPGRYRVAIDYQADGQADSIGYMMFHAGGGFKFLRPLTSSGGQAKQDFCTVDISTNECKKRSSVWVWYDGRGTLSVARLAVEKTVR